MSQAKQAFSELKPKAKSVTILGIETSCDESSVAVVRNGSECLSNIIHSQFGLHRPFKGIVPEIASRAHLERINPIYEKALEIAKLSISDIDYIAVTNRPGLAGSLMVGAAMAKSISLVTGIPVLCVNHVQAHLYAACTEGWEPSYPFIGLILSGANSTIYIVEGVDKFQVFADTLDDACGEAFDKVANMLDLPYPGASEIERMAQTYLETQMRPTEIALFPSLMPKMQASKPAFSFSGIKTAVLRAKEKAKDPQRIAYYFQETVFELVLRNLSYALKKTGISSVVAGEGVLANKILRRDLKKLCDLYKCQLCYPRKLSLCTDNAAMIASRAYYLHSAGRLKEASLDFDVYSYQHEDFA